MSTGGTLYSEGGLCFRRASISILAIVMRRAAPSLWAGSKRSGWFFLAKSRRMRRRSTIARSARSPSSSAIVSSSLFCAQASCGFGFGAADFAVAGCSRADRTDPRADARTPAPARHPPWMWPSNRRIGPDRGRRERGLFDGPGPFRASRPHPPARKAPEPAAHQPRQDRARTPDATDRASRSAN